MLLPNIEGNIVNNTVALRHRIDELSRVYQLNQPIAAVDNFLLQSVQDVTVDWNRKISRVKNYQSQGDDVCLLRAVKIGLQHLSDKNLLSLGGEVRAYSRAASASSCFAPVAGFFRNRGIEKQIERLAQIETFVDQLEATYLVARVLHRLGLG
jgi:hypothetical protein